MEELEKLIGQLLEDPDTVDRLKSLVGDVVPQTEQNGIDADMMLKITKAMSAFGSLSDDNGARLLCDLKPYISDSRCKRVDEAVQMLKLIRVMNILGKE
ncbi:MAG: hypothetical protein IJ408_00990 [Clostridia bacterium]|nr:hypothetical protein [Clostridia bacterium]